MMFLSETDGNSYLLLQNFIQGIAINPKRRLAIDVAINSLKRDRIEKIMNELKEGNAESVTVEELKKIVTIMPSPEEVTNTNIPIIPTFYNILCLKGL